MCLHPPHIYIYTQKKCNLKTPTFLHTVPLIWICILVYTGVNITSKLFDKRQSYNFEVIDYPFLPCNIPDNAVYGVFVSQLIRLCQDNSNIHNLRTNLKELCKTFMMQGFGKERLISEIQTFSKEIC